MVETGSHEVLASEAVGQLALTCVHVCAERITGAQLICRAIDVQREGRTEARNEVPLPVPVVGKDVVVVLLGHRDRRRQGHRPLLGGRSGEPQQLEWICASWQTRRTRSGLTRRSRWLSSGFARGGL